MEPGTGCRPEDVVLTASVAVLQMANPKRAQKWFA